MGKLDPDTVGNALTRSSIKRAAREFKGAVDAVEASLGPVLSEFAEALKETGALAEKAVTPMLAGLQELDRAEKSMRSRRGLNYKMELIRNVHGEGLLSPEGVKKMLEIAEAHSPRPRTVLPGQEKAETALNLLKMGVISPNGAREMLGLKAVNDAAIATAFAVSPGALIEVTDADGNNGQYVMKDPSMIAKMSGLIVDPGGVRRAFLGVRSRLDCIY